MAIPKPTDIPRWADTDPTKRVQPSTAKADVGWDPEEKPPAQYENWLLYTIYKWCEWLNDITNQSLVWAAAHSFNEGLTASRTTPNTNAITTIGNGSGAGVFARGGSTGVGVRGEGFGASAPGIDGYGDTSGGAGGAGVRGTGGSGSAGVLGTGNAAGSGVSGTGGGTGGAGVAGTGGAGSGPGLFGRGGTVNGPGILAIGTGSGSGVLCQSGGIELFNNADQIFFTNAKSYTRTPRGFLYLDASEWSVNNVGVFTQIHAPSGAGSRRGIPWIIAVPDGAVIVSISVRIDPASGHGALPGVMPEFTLIEIDPALGSSATITNKVDTSATVMVYEAAHLITQSGLSYTVSGSKQILCTIYGEQGPNEIDGALFWAPFIQFDRAQIGEE